jgi:hypothetical protein
MESSFSFREREGEIERVEKESTGWREENSIPCKHLK